MVKLVFFFTDVAKDINTRETDLRLICFEDGNDAQQLGDLLVNSYSDESHQVKVIVLPFSEAKTIAMDLNLHAFIVRRREIQLEPNWTINDYTTYLSQIHEIRESQ